MSRTPSPTLGPVLEQVYRVFHDRRYLGSDPLEFVHAYREPADQEAMAVTGALFAYGGVNQIRAGLTQLRLAWDAYGGPSRLVRDLHTPRAPEAALVILRSGFKHRFHTAQDALLLLWLLGRSWEAYGTLGRQISPDPTDPDFGPALSRVLADWKLAARTAPFSAGPHFEHLLASPSDGSCCKRWCMLLRWMVRKDELDLGLWAEWISPGQLVMPLDTHTGALAQLLGLTRRKTLHWRAAQEITRALARFDSTDPVRFDFSLCRLGILDLCQKRWVPEVCGACALFGHCRHTVRKRPQLC